jgi:hypothetical protein
MVDLCNISVPKTSKELEQAIQRYRMSNLKGIDLFCQWLAIRDASLAQNGSEIEGDHVPGESSY